MPFGVKLSKKISLNFIDSLWVLNPPPNFDAPPQNKKNAISCEPVKLKTSFNDHKMQK